MNNLTWEDQIKDACRAFDDLANKHKQNHPNIDDISLTWKDDDDTYVVIYKEVFGNLTKETEYEVPHHDDALLKAIQKFTQRFDP